MHGVTGRQRHWTFVVAVVWQGRAQGRARGGQLKVERGFWRACTRYPRRQSRRQGNRIAATALGSIRARVGETSRRVWARGGLLVHLQRREGPRAGEARRGRPSGADGAEQSISAREERKEGGMGWRRQAGPGAQ